MKAGVGKKINVILYQSVQGARPRPEGVPACTPRGLVEGVGVLSRGHPRTPGCVDS